MRKKRNAWVAGVTSFLAPGLGHMYAGAPARGCLIVAGFIAALLTGGAFGAFSTFYGIIALAFIVLLFNVILVSSAVMSARSSKDYELRWYNRWYWYATILVLVTSGIQLLVSYRGSVFGYDTFRIPSASMVPTLQAGDYITVDARYRDPAIGDVVVFRYPGSPKITYVGRIAALGGDSIAIESGEVVVNGMVREALSTPSGYREKEFSAAMPARKVPEGEFFMLGDWRDNSSDSRLWGTVPTENIVGKATYIWLSNDPERIGSDVR